MILLQIQILNYACIFSKFRGFQQPTLKILFHDLECLRCEKNSNEYFYGQVYVPASMNIQVIDL